MKCCIYCARNSTNGNNKTGEDEETECDLGFQVVTKAADEEVKTTASQVSECQTSNTNSTSAYNICTATTTMPTFTSLALSMVMPMPSLPTVQLPPPPPLPPLPTTTGILHNNNKAMFNLPTTTTPPIFPIPTSNNNATTLSKPLITIPACSSASSVGCLILDPQQLQTPPCSLANDNFKKECSSNNNNNNGMGLFHGVTTSQPRSNPPLITKIRRVQPSPQTAAINLSYSAAAAAAAAATTTSVPPIKVRKLSSGERAADIDVSAILQASRELDANTLFFLSLARSVRAMPTKLQSLAKMRCMRIVSDLELELDNAGSGDFNLDEATAAAAKYCDATPPPTELSTPMQNQANSEGATEHFVYVMSPSRVESLIDISSDDELAASANST